jgi:anti-sigma factor RsiW
MSTSTHLNELACGYAEQALDGARLEEARAHVDSCPACARDVAIQHQVRESLRARASALREAAPPPLEARIRAAVGRRTVIAFERPARAQAPRPAWRARRFVPASLAAGLLLAVAAGALSPSGSVLAAQLALDHLKCKLIAPVAPGSDARQLGERWKAERGWPVQVPASSPDLRLELVGLRNCLYHDGTLAHVMYDLRGRRLSLFVMPHAHADAHALTVLGQRTVTWTKGDRAYAVVAPAEAGDLGAVAAYFRDRAF